MSTYVSRIGTFKFLFQPTNYFYPGQNNYLHTSLYILPSFYVEETTIMLDATTEQGHNLKGTGMRRHNTGNSGIPESLEDRDVEYLHNKRR